MEDNNQMAEQLRRIQLSPAQRTQIQAAAVRLRINARDHFLRRVAAALTVCAQPVGPNDVTQCLKIVLMGRAIS
jgi:hypothetical protein